MTTKKHLTSFAVLAIFAFLYWASATVQPVSFENKVYTDTKKAPENIVVSYKLPVIKPTGKTTQMQIKDGVTITTEIVPFTANRTIKQVKQITYADPTKNGYDIYEVANKPEYEVFPKDINFKIRIRNNEQVPLKLSEIGFAIIIDGLQWSWPTGYLEEWNKGIILTGFEKEFILKGPQLDGLFSAKVVYIFLNGVPTSYDQAGSVKKKSNFEWYFECSTDVVNKEEEVTYSYEPLPIEQRRCVRCSGTGTDPQPYKCSQCNGTGIYQNPYDKKNYKCSNCEGSGRVYRKCSNCSNGVTYHPKSPETPVHSSEIWSGWKVLVKSVPSGATIISTNPNTGKHSVLKCITPCTIDWYCSTGKTCPITVEYGGKKVDVYPLKPNGKESSLIEVDFRSSTPVVKTGKQMNN